MRRLGALLLIPCVAGLLAATLQARADSLFGPPQNFPAGDGPVSVAIGDLDGDGDGDLAVADIDSDRVSVLLGNGDGTFGAFAGYIAGDGPFAVAIGDFDSDLNRDLVVANWYSGNVSVLLGNGDGTFQVCVNYDTGANAHAVAVADLDADGDGDLVVANCGSDSVSVLLGNGDGTFQAGTEYGAGDGPFSVVISDLDGDFNEDLVVANWHSDNVSVLLGNGDGTFEARVDYGAGSAPTFAAIGDLDGNGDKDLAVANRWSHNVSVLLGNGDGTFQACVNYDAGTDPHSVVIADLNGDADKDLAVANWKSDNVSVLLNHSSGIEPPDPSITSISDVGNDQGREVRLRWLRSGHDAPGSAVIVTGYGVYRRQDGYLSELRQSLVQSIDLPSLRDGVRLEGWDYIATVPARGDSFYQYVAPTLCDSTEQHGICWSVFFVSAMTQDPLVYFDSLADSGYSVDNLAPEPPLTVRGQFEPQTGYIDLSWSPTSSIDLQYYELHRGVGPDFEPSIDSRIYTDVDTFYVDHSSLWNQSTYYKVAAVDFAWNKSEYASLSALETGVPIGEVPGSLALHPPSPNPFTPATTLAYDLPERAGVSLHVYDASGRRVRTVLEAAMHEAGHHTATWDGRDDEGRRVASGVYFCRVEAGGRALMERMVLLR